VKSESCLDETPEPTLIFACCISFSRRLMLKLDTPMLRVKPCSTNASMARQVGRGLPYLSTANAR
jgi:hypothetical protein